MKCKTDLETTLTFKIQPVIMCSHHYIKVSNWKTSNQWLHPRTSNTEMISVETVNNTIVQWLTTHRVDLLFNGGQIYSINWEDYYRNSWKTTKLVVPGLYWLQLQHKKLRYTINIIMHFMCQLISDVTLLNVIYWCATFSSFTTIGTLSIMLLI